MTKPLPPRADSPRCSRSSRSTDVPVTGTGCRGPGVSPHPPAIFRRTGRVPPCPATRSTGFPRVDPRARSAGWKRAVQRVVATRPGAAVHRTIAARLDTPIMKATGGRVNPRGRRAVPVVVLTTTGARQRPAPPRDAPRIFHRR